MHTRLTNQTHTSDRHADAHADLVDRTSYHVQATSSADGHVIYADTLTKLASSLYKHTTFFGSIFSHDDLHGADDLLGHGG